MADTWEDVLSEPESGSRKEIPAPDWVFTQRPDVQAPESEIEALMMAVPGEELDWADNEIQPDTYDKLDSILGVQLDLDEVEKEVLDALYVAGHSIRDAATILNIPQTTVWRIKESAIERIRRRSSNQ